MKSFKDISEKLKKDKDDPCWKGYVQVGMKKKDGKEVPNCVPKEGVDEKKDTHKTKDGRTAKKGLWYNINQKKKRGEAPAKKGDPDYPKTLNIESIEEKAVSKAQQKFMGMVRAKQKGEMDDASPEVAKAAASMSKKDVKDFAKTKHKGLPDKKESVEIEEASGKDIAAKMMKSKSMKAFAAKVARMPNVSAGDLEKMLPDYVSGAEIRGLFKEVTEGPDYLGDIRRKKEREERKKASQHAGETQRQKTMRKAYGNYMGGLKKGYGESVELGEKVNTSEEEAIQIIANSIAMQEPAVKAALKAANLDPVSVVTALKGKKTIKATQLGNLVMDHAFGGSINKRDLAPIAKAASAAFKASPKKVKEEVDLEEANRNHPAAKKLMALAKQRDAGSDAKDYEKAAQMIMKGDAGQLGRFISRMDSYPRDAVISAVKSTDKAMYDKMVSRMESAEPMNFFEFRQALNEAQLYHNSFSAAVQHAMKQVQKKGYEIDEDDWQRKVASGPSKPSAGKTNRYTVNLMKNGKPVKQKLQMQVYGMDSGKYELNMYVS